MQNHVVKHLLKIKYDNHSSESLQELCMSLYFIKGCLTLKTYDIIVLFLLSAKQYVVIPTSHCFNTDYGYRAIKFSLLGV